MAESVLDEESVMDDELLKLPKRKQTETKDNTVKTKKVTKTDPQCPSSQSEGHTQNSQERDCEDENMQVEMQSGYSFLRIRRG